MASASRFRKEIFMSMSTSKHNLCEEAFLKIYYQNFAPVYAITVTQNADFTFLCCAVLKLKNLQ